MALGFGFLAVGSVLVFLYRDRKRSFQALTDSAKLGSASVDDEASLQAVAAQLAAAAGGAGGAPIFSIFGPTTLPTSTATTYVVRNPPAGAVAWNVDGDATISSSAGNSTRLTASQAGGIVLSAMVGNQMVELEITATAPQRSFAIPFLGQGYGSVVIALAVASVTAALGLTNIINGQAVAGVLGSLVTYSVVRGSSSGSGTGTSRASATGASQGD